MEEPNTQPAPQSQPSPAGQSSAGQNRPKKGGSGNTALYAALAVLVVLFLAAQYQIGTLNAKLDVLSAAAVAGSDAPTAPSGNTAPSAGTAPSVQKVDKITIEEFSDFECPFCGRAQGTIQQIKDTYGDKVEVVYKHFPLSFHPNAQKAAEASECARDQGSFEEYHDRLFSNQQALSVSQLKGYAADMGLDTEQFDTCLDSGEKAADVQADFAEGQRKGVTGTPAFFIEGEKIVGAQPYSNFKAVIDKYLA